MELINAFDNVGDTGDEFDLVLDVGEPMNLFKIIHLENQKNCYHLTRQVLLDSMLTQDTYCFFYHILAKGVDEFNDDYGSFACLIPRSDIEADLYLNVDPDALHYIVKLNI